MIKRIAVVKWAQHDGIASTISHELDLLGIEPVLFLFNGPVPQDVDMVLTFAPYGSLLPIASQLGQMDPRTRPIYVHWNTENPPDPQIPWPITKNVARLRSGIGQLCDSSHPITRIKPIQWINRRMHRFQMLGDYEYAIQKGWLDILVETSSLFAQNDIAHGLPSVFVPWGSSPDWYEDLHLERDIDVLWFGKRRTNRRGNLIDSIRKGVQKHGAKMMVVDGVERPFIHGEERTQILNRTKIVINLLTHPYEYVCPFRFHMVAGNRCMVIAEPELNHHPGCLPGKHLITAPADQIVEKILYYLSHEQERMQIVENAYQLATRELTLANSLKTILSIVQNRFDPEGLTEERSEDSVAAGYSF